MSHGECVFFVFVLIMAYIFYIYINYEGLSEKIFLTAKDAKNAQRTQRETNVSYIFAIFA